ncbi:GNAT family N-acetyltransferase [bacterium]
MNMQFEKFKIRDFQEGDETSIACHANNRNIWRNLKDVFPHPYSMNDARDFLSLVLEKQLPNTFAIEVQGEAAGVISLLPKTDVYYRTAELGYWLAESFWNQGIMTEAIRSITEWGFKYLEFYRIEATVFEWNHMSIRVLDKVGFTQEARLKKSVTKDGQTIDTFLYAIIRNEWDKNS